MDVEGKLAMVTGAASGIGRRTARAFAKAGAELALVDVNAEGLARVAAECEAAGSRVATYVADLSQVAQIRDLFSRVREAHGRLDALVNVAGIYPSMRTAKVTEEHWDAVLGTNLRGVFFCCQEAMKIMGEQDSGAVVNIASGAAFRPLPHMAAYCASKAGLVGMTRVFAFEASRTGVRFNIVAPGYTATEGNQLLVDDEVVTAGSEKLVSGRYVEPDEVADAIVFVCSDAARAVQGAILNVNTGTWMP